MVRSWFGRKSRGQSSLRLYYASDIHGSDVCWRKFLNAAKFYEVGALIMGGDLAGKALAPVVASQDGWTVPIGGQERRASTEKEVQEMETLLRQSGFYPLRITRKEFERVSSDSDLLAHRFEETIVASVRGWMDLADQRLSGSQVVAYVMPGNDDPWAIDEALKGREHVVACDDCVVRIGDHELLSLGWSNRTPWNTPRELDEDGLYKSIHKLVDQLECTERAIFNLHVPPYDSGLDTATELDETLRPVLISGQPHEIPVGSTAVRQVIEEVQPALALHGHIHESRGITNIGRTVCINPGSKYASGRIDGVVVELDDQGVRHKRLVTG
ncbi:MAG TPA: metallophosphoesterase [Candidatus Dormibacteraeota bacterium]|nr:metallophosphoesterase [Candidatus Dormibacteraeota bacterium]